MRGLAVVARAIDVGSTLATCESMPGFPRLLTRFRQGERGAYSEAKYAAALVRIGCRPELEPVSGSGLLDTAVDWNGVRIFTEVISPERAEAIAKVQTDVQALASAIRDTLSGSTLEVLLDTDLTPEVQGAILHAAPELPLGEVTSIAGIATVVRRASSLPLQLGPTLPSPGDTPVIAAASGKLEAGVGTAGIVRMPILDERARRLLAAELHHFARDSHNILAIDLTGIPVSPKNWAPLIRRSFQPQQNRRIGAVAFFSRGLLGTPITTREQWAIIPNPHAYHAIPPDLIDRISSLDESVHFRGTPGPAA